jgi:hypothetical protein
MKTVSGMLLLLARCESFVSPPCVWLIQGRPVFYTTAVSIVVPCRVNHRLSQQKTITYHSTDQRQNSKGHYLPLPVLVEAKINVERHSKDRCVSQHRPPPVTATTTCNSNHHPSKQRLTQSDLLTRTIIFHNIDHHLS